MKGVPSQFADFRFLDALPASAPVCDVIYRPLKTELLKEAEKRGHQTMNGLGMLIHQAILALELFAAMPLDAALMKKAVEKKADSGAASESLIRNGARPVPNAAASMIPRGADFPPDSAPSAKRRVSETMRRENLALRRFLPCRPPSHRQKCGAVRTMPCPPCCDDAQAGARRSSARHDAGRARPAPPKKRQLFHPPQNAAAVSPGRQTLRPRLLRRIFSALPRKKEPTRSQVGSFSGYSLAAAFSLEHFLRAFPRGFGNAEKYASAFQVLKLFGRYSPQPESSCSGGSSGRRRARMTRSTQTLVFTDPQ